MVLYLNTSGTCCKPCTKKYCFLCLCPPTQLVIRQGDIYFFTTLKVLGLIVYQAAHFLARCYILKCPISRFYRITLLLCLASHSSAPGLLIGSFISSDLRSDFYPVLLRAFTLFGLMCRVAGQVYNKNFFFMTNGLL